MVSHLKWLVVFSFLTTFCYEISFSEATRIPEQKFEKKYIRLGGKKILVEIAKTIPEHQHGLMYRNSLPENQGMLFIFETEQQLSFWMKNTYIDLAIAYIDKNKKIVDIQEMKSTSPLMVGEPSAYPSLRPAQYALEMNKGWFKKNSIKVGQKFSFIQ